MFLTADVYVIVSVAQNDRLMTMKA